MTTGTPGSSPDPRLSGTRPALPPLTVLFVDPDRASAERLARALAGATVAVVPGVQAAWSAMQTRLPDVVVTELDLPSGGIEFLASIRNTPTTRHILLMVVTARTLVGDKIAAFQAGADDYLVKPVDPHEFETHLLLVSRFRRVIRG
ncbi:MAG TPA: response regulator [Ktedonobacterales bacterium]